ADIPASASVSYTHRHAPRPGIAGILQEVHEDFFDFARPRARGWPRLTREREGRRAGSPPQRIQINHFARHGEEVYELQRRLLGPGRAEPGKRARDGVQSVD